MKIPAHKLLLLSGPCQIESELHALKTANLIQKALQGLPFHLVYKSSYDKANRTSLSGGRGVGIHEGLRILERVRNETGLQLVTDVHNEHEASAAGQVVDIIQTPAFLCRQTDLLIAAGKTKKAVNIKKGQFLHPEDMKFAAEKVSSTGNKNIFLCERGATFGYRDLVVDFRSFQIMSSLGYPVIFDATHSVQSMGGERGASGGSREYIPMLVKASIAAGVSGLFIETHEDPASAPSDGKSMLPLNELRSLLESAARIYEATQK